MRGLSQNGHYDSKSTMLVYNMRSQLRLDGTIGQWEPGTGPSSPDHDHEWEAHKLLHCKAIQPDFRLFKAANQGQDGVKITVNRTAQKIRFLVGTGVLEGQAPLPVQEVWKQVVRFQQLGQLTGIRGPLLMHNCHVRLRSRADNRGAPNVGPEPLWVRETTAPFVLIKLPWPFQGEPLLVAPIELSEVPIGWAILEVWMEDEQGNSFAKKTMQVFVYPEIRCKNENGRWWLLPPSEEALPFRQFEAEPMPLPERLIRPIRLEEGVYTIDAALWKQRDDYFKGTRYDPAGITDYNTAPNPNFSVDGAGGTDVHDQDGVSRKKYCGPRRGAPGL